MFSFAVMIVCVFLAIAEFFKGDIGIALIDIGLALVCLPSFIKWIKDIY